MIKQKQQPMSFWKPMKITTVKINPKFIQPIKLSQYPIRTKQEIRLIDKSPWKDSDRDKVPNYFDCKPLNRKRQEAKKWFDSKFNIDRRSGEHFNHVDFDSVPLTSPPKSEKRLPQDIQGRKNEEHKETIKRLKEERKKYDKEIMKLKLKQEIYTENWKKNINDEKIRKELDRKERLDKKAAKIEKPKKYIIEPEIQKSIITKTLPSKEKPGNVVLIYPPIKSPIKRFVEKTTGNKKGAIVEYFSKKEKFPREEIKKDFIEKESQSFKVPRENIQGIEKETEEVKDKNPEDKEYREELSEEEYENEYKKSAQELIDEV